MDAPATLTLDQLRAASAAGGIASVTLRGEGGVFYVAVSTVRGSEQMLVTTRSRAPRGFADPRKALLLLREAGIDRAQVDAAGWAPDTAPRAGRPDRAEALRRVHSAAEYDAWFRREVEGTLADVKAGRAALIPHEVVEAEWRERREALLARIAKAEG